MDLEVICPRKRLGRICCYILKEVAFLGLCQNQMQIQIVRGARIFAIKGVQNKKLPEALSCVIIQVIFPRSANLGLIVC